MFSISRALTAVERGEADPRQEVRRSRRRPARSPPRSLCSACSTSGRRSSSAAGSPAGISGAFSCSIKRSPRGISPGGRPSRMRELVLLRDDLALEIGDRGRRARERRLRARGREPGADAADELSLEEIERLLERVARPQRDLELEVELAQLEIGLRDVGHQREHDRRAARPRRRRGRPAKPPSRGGCGPRDRSPRPSGTRRRRDSRSGCRPVREKNSPRSAEPS